MATAIAPRTPIRLATSCAAQDSAEDGAIGRSDHNCDDNDSDSESNSDSGSSNDGERPLSAQHGTAPRRSARIARQQCEDGSRRPAPHIAYRPMSLDLLGGFPIVSTAACGSV